MRPLAGVAQELVWAEILHLNSFFILFWSP